MHGGDRLKAAVHGFNTTFTANNGLVLYLLFWFTLTCGILKALSLDYFWTSFV